MDTKNIMMAIAIIVIAIFLLVGKNEKNETPSDVGSSLMFTNAVQDEIDQILITEKGATLTLVKKDKKWTAKEKYDYPVNEDKILELIKDIYNINKDTFYTKDKNDHKQFDLVDPSSNEEGSGKKIELIAKSGKSAGGAIFGKMKTSKQQSNNPYAMANESQFVRKLGEDTVYLSKESISLSAAPSNWLKKDIMDIKKNAVREVQIHSKDKEELIIKIDNPSASPVLQNIPENLKARDYQVSSLPKNAENLKLDSLLSADDAKDIAFDNKFTLKTFEGLNYIFEISESLKDHNDHHAFKITAVIDEEYINTKEEVEQENKPKKLSIDQAKAFANEFNEKHSNWRYLLASWMSKKFIKDLKEVTEEIKKEEPPAEPKPEQDTVSEPQSEPIEEPQPKE